MKRLIYADTYSLGAFHETFNASSLMMFSTIYAEIIYYAPTSSKKCVERLLGQLPENVEYSPLLFWGKDGGTFWCFLRYLSSFIWNIILALKQKKDEVLYFNYNSLWALKIINIIARCRKTDILITCHGELEYMRNGTKLNAPAQAGLNLLANPHWNIADTLHFCVLGESILKNLPRIVAGNHIPHFISFEHSFIPHPSKPHKQDKIYRIGTVGTIRPQKGLKDILAIGQVLSNVPDVEFYALGYIACQTETLVNSHVKYIPGAEQNYVPKDILNQYIDAMDCLIFTYPMDGYKFTASGALFDAIDREKTILSLHNDYFDHLFGLAPFGLLFDSVDEMVEYLKDEVRSKERLSIHFAQNKEILSFKGAATAFKETLTSLNLI